MKTVIIGQSQSGKSALLAGLHLASLHDNDWKSTWWQNVRGAGSVRNGSSARRRASAIQVECHRLNPAFQELSQRFASTLRRGFFSPDATDDILVYELDLRARRPWVPWEMVGQRRVAAWCGIRTRVEMPDGPGGALFDTNPNYAAFRRELVQHLQQADGVILCIPASLRGPAHSAEEENTKRELEDEKRKFFEFFYGLVAEINSGQGPVPWRHLAVTLTKADQVFFSHGRNAQEAVMQNSTPERLMEWLIDSSFSEMLIQQVQIATGHRVRIGAGWTSIYGFTNSGTANYDPKEHKLLISPPQYRQAEVLANWHPYQLIDPFLYAAAGYTMPDQRNGFPGFVTIA